MSEPGTSVNAAQVLGAAAAATSYRLAPEKIRARIVDVFIDTLAVWCVGSDRSALRRLQGLLGGPEGGATVIGRSQPASVSAATVANGSTATV